MFIRLFYNSFIFLVYKFTENLKQFQEKKNETPKERKERKKNHFANNIEMVSKCINRVELKEKNIFTTKFNLPPNVNGQCRGRLTLCLNDIYWINDGPSNFDTIHAKIVWWGDVINSSATLK